MSGTHLAGIDFDWLMANLEVGELPADPEGVKRVTLVLGPKAQHAAEGYVVGLFQMYPTVYLHKTTRCAEKMAQLLLWCLMREIRSGNVTATGLPENHPLVALSSDPENPNVLMELDDTVVMGALPLLSQSLLPTIGTFASRLRNRDFFKSIDLDAEIKKSLPADPTEADKLYVRRRENTIGKITKWLDDKHIGRVLLDQAERKPYKLIDDEGAMNQIWLRDINRLIDLREKSAAVAAISPFRLFRVYVDAADNEARLIVRGAVDEAIREE